MAGEVTQTTVILQSRLTATPGLEDGDVRGAAGWGKFEYADSPDFLGSRQTEWIEAKAENDYILRQQLRGLNTGRTYFYRLMFGADQSRTETGPVRKFKTLAAADQPVSVRFAVGNCMNYAFFFNGPKDDGRKARTDATDRQLGYPAMESIRKLQPDFFVGAGDNVYYDHPAKTAAQTRPELRRKWHEQFVLPRVVDMVGQAATFWMKDDHDYRYNDADRTGNKAPSHELGVRTFREQLPVVASPDSAEVTYRTVRCGQLLQVWMVEGRDYRSPNKSPDGPEKTIWGAEQKAWLKRTVLASDATFKILISPTPLIGPDDAYKSDNHTGGFRHEGEEFFAWLKANRQNNFYIINGDRHWHYHSIHPTGYEEFACGALNAENSRLGRNPGDLRSTDPQAKVKQLYTDVKPTGGYLLAEISPSKHGEPARLHFSIQDEWGKELYSHTKTALAAPTTNDR
jgi:alkaline phosphatase/alkaline phosphatase D